MRQSRWQQRLALLLACCALLGAAQQAPVAEPEHASRISCRVHVANNTASPASGLGHASSSLKVAAAADVADLSVIVQVQHPDVAALEVSLAATASPASSARVLLKAPSYGASGGADMVQTIFSDFAPGGFPSEASEAPYSSVYQPAEPLRLLVAGNSTAAGSGGSRGVWTLTVRDTGYSKANRRPLKLAGWELWLCGESSGPLFAPADPSAIAFDVVLPGAPAEVTVVKKAVPTPAQLDVDVVVKAGARAQQVADDPVAQVVERFNTYLSKELAAKFDALAPLLSRVSSPKLAAALNTSAAAGMSAVSQMPAALGYTRNADGTWGLPSSEAVIKGFLDTLTHCYHDLYWCWKATGLQGEFGLNFVNTWDAAAQPVAAHWAANQQQWLDAINRFEAQYPGLSGWGDVLFQTTIGNVYRAAQLDAVASVGEAWFDTAVRLALYLSPIRFAANPRALAVQVTSLVEIVLRTVFNLFQYVTMLTDGDNNNDVEAITLFVQGLTNATREAFDIAALGLNTRAQGMRRQIQASAGGFASNAADMNLKLASRLSEIDPRLGAIYSASTQDVNNVLRGVAQAQQDRVADYFRSQAARQGLLPKLEETLTLGGQAVTQLANSTATVLKQAQKALDDALPGPNLQDILTDARKGVEGILSDAQAALSKLVPLPELQEMDALLRATVSSVLDILRESAEQVNDSDGAKAIQQQLGALAKSLGGAQSSIGKVVDGVVKSFPGPLLNSTLEGVRLQANKTIVDVQRMFGSLAKDFPNLGINATDFSSKLSNTLEELTTNALDAATSFETVAGPEATKALGAALPGTMQPVADVVKAAAAALPSLLPAPAQGAARDAQALTSQLQEGIGGALSKFASRVQALADALPNQPPLAAIHGHLAARSKDLAESSKGVSDAMLNAITAPQQLAEAQLDDLNAKLEALVTDLKSQNARGNELTKLLVEGPIKDVADGINKTLGPIAGAVQGTIDQLTAGLPKLPDLRKALNDLLGPPLAVLDTVVADASQAALQAATAASKGAVSVVADASQQLTRALIQGQWQLAALLKAAGQAGEQLQAAAAAAAEGLQGPLSQLDAVLASVAKAVSGDLEKALAALAPPPEVFDKLVRPLVAALDKQLGQLGKGLPPTPEGLGALLEGTASVVGGLLNETAAALGLPAPPPLPPLPSLPLPGKPADGKPGKPEPAGEQPAKPSAQPKPEEAAAAAGGGDEEAKAAAGQPAAAAAAPQGRRLLALVGPVSAPGWDAAAFQRSAAEALRGAAESFANSAVAAAAGRPGASGVFGSGAALQALTKQLSGAAEQVDKFLGALPTGGKLLKALLGGASGARPVAALAQLQAQLKDAAGQPAAAQGPIVAAVAAVLDDLARGDDAGLAAAARGAVEQALRAAGGGAAAAGSFGDAASRLQAFRASLQQAIARAAPGGN